MPGLQQDPVQSKELYPVNIRRLRLVYRDLIAASAAGDNIFRALSSIAPVLRVEQYTVAWTGKSDIPLVAKRDMAFASGEREDRSVGVWYKFKANSPLVQIVLRESSAYYPDATRPYPFFVEAGKQAYKLVIGNKLISISFDTENPLARLEQQRNSLLDMISQALLDYSRRQLRHLQEQSINTSEIERSITHPMAVDRQVAAFMDDESSEEQALSIMQKHASVLENFFGFSHVEYLMSPEIHSVLFNQQKRHTLHLEDRDFIDVRLAVSEYPPLREFVSDQMAVLEAPLTWGANNEDDAFIIRLYSHHPVNPHVRRELLLNQALLQGKAELEALFDRRYRELRIAQDNSHFRRCKQVRASMKSFGQLRDHLVNSMPEYGAFRRGLERVAVFPRFEEWQTALDAIFVDTSTEWLEFQYHIRLSDILDFKLLDIRAPRELHTMLAEALRVNVKLRVVSEFPVLARLSDPAPEAEPDEGFSERILFFNDAATISVLIPEKVTFPFQRVAEMFNEYLDSIGEGISRLFQSVSMMTGIQNRASLVRKLEHLIQQVKYSHLVSLDVSMLDIVSFKIFNELFGHPFGDRVIRTVAQNLDIAAPNMAFHVSGDEYFLIHCWYSGTTEDWVAEFFRTYNIISEAEYRNLRKKLETFAKGQPIAVPLVDVMTSPLESTPILGTYRLVTLVSNFFTKDTGGKLQLKKYSRNGNDYQNVIWDPQKRLQALVDMVWEAIQNGLDIEGDAFTSFILQNSTVGDRIFILPKLTLGTVHYEKQKILAYASDIILAADSEAGKNKR